MKTLINPKFFIFLGRAFSAKAWPHLCIYPRPNFRNPEELDLSENHQILKSKSALLLNSATMELDCSLSWHHTLGMLYPFVSLWLFVKTIVEEWKLCWKWEKFYIFPIQVNRLSNWSMSLAMASSSAPEISGPGLPSRCLRLLIVWCISLNRWSTVVAAFLTSVSEVPLETWSSCATC